MRLRLIAIAVFLPLVVQASGHNLAADIERALASSSAPRHPAGHAVDSSEDTYWSAEGTAAEPAWLQLNWRGPVIVREIVIRRIGSEKGKPDATRLQIEEFLEGNWKTVQILGDGSSPLPVLIWARLPETKVERLRISGFRAPVSIREVEVYADRSSPYLDVRGDAHGGMLGVLTDQFGAHGIQTEVAIAGTAAKKPWSAHVNTDASGAFSVALPVGLAGPITLSAAVDGETVTRTIEPGDVHEGLVPKPEGEFTMKLNGNWKFRANPPAGFEQPGMDDRGWDSIRVPSHWVMEGFRSVTGAAGYRRVISIPEEWRGRRIRLAFDGVYSGAEVWCNGLRAGSHLGGATPFQLDITDAVRPGVQNLVALRVNERSKASDLDNMSNYADFSLGGIFRSVYVFAVPAVHISRLHANTTFDGDHRNSTLMADVTVVNESDAGIAAGRVELSVAGAKSSEPFILAPWSKMEKLLSIHVANPRQWTAEHPNLYQLAAVVYNGSAELDRAARRIGFRETRIRGTQLLINGVPVKLKGTCHHDSHPTMGRAVTPELEKQDLLLIKEANLDSLRTSHYPPLPELLDLADELGVYVEDEASFCWVYNSNDLRYSALTRQLTSELVERDRSHPSVIYWSAGNESAWGPILLAGERMIREADPTRPVVGSWSDHFDMEIHHNPITLSQIREYESHSRPVIWDESLCIWQGIWNDGEELWRDPGYRDYYVAPLVDIWEALWHSKTTQGSFIWAWSDDLFLVPGRAFEYGRYQTESHGLDRVYHRPGSGLVGDAPWGVVDGWRRRKPEFWHTKELHSPVKVTVRKLARPPEGEPLRIPVENRYFFSNLDELETQWRIADRRGTLRVSVAPQKTGNIEVPFAGAPGSDLELRFVDRAGRMVDRAAIQVGDPPPAVPIREGELRVRDRQDLSDEAFIACGDGFEIAFSKIRGLFRYALLKGETVLYEQPQIRILPVNDAFPPFPHRLRWALDEPPTIESRPERVTVTIRGHYRDLAGTYQTAIAPGGRISMSYQFHYTGPDVRAREIGWRFSVPLSMENLSWQRKGEWTWYPDGHIGALRGTAQAHSGRRAGGVPGWPYGEDDSPMGTNLFRATKRNIVKATIEDADGRRIVIESDGSQHLRAAVENDRIAVHVNDWFGGTNSRAGEWVENYGDGRLIRTGERIEGKLELRLAISPR